MMPTPVDDFEWIRTPWGSALRCRALQAHADHLFTTRQPSLPADTLAPGDGWHRLALAFGLPVAHLVRLRQVHGTSVVVVRSSQALSAEWGSADAAITDHRQAALCVKVADCVPVLLADARTGAIGAVHAGWRGSASGAVVAALEAMGAAFGSRPADVVAAVGPSIGPCCYRVGPDVSDVFASDPRWTGLVDRWFSPAPVATPVHGVPGPPPSPDVPSRFLDTWRANADQLAAAGVPAPAIHVARLCTSCHRDVFHSYRVDGPRAGRMVGVIRMK